MSDKNEIEMEMEMEMEMEIEIYTDGACSFNPGPGGYGVVMLYGEHRKELSQGYKLTTNNRMELLAIIVGLENLKRPSSLTLYSDSKYVIDSVEKGWVYKWQKNNWKRNKNEMAVNIDLWERLLPLLEKNDVKFVWVKGHADNKENNRCDYLARMAIKDKDKSELLDDVNYK
ncbi:MAG: ribonuclease HI [bacterium]